MEFGLLGSLTARTDAGPVQVSAGKQRVVLAALLLRANQVVPAEDLARAVWEERAPETARVTLQNYVKRLRRTLGVAGYKRIVTHPAGYVITVGPEELDLAVFTARAAAGQAAARAGKWQQAEDECSAALALWRGQPLADVPSRVLVATEVPRLAELRLEVAESRLDAGLHLGRHRELVAELVALAAAEPLRERVNELLMLALYRSGQQAAALAAYRIARRHLVDEVGIEPSPALRDLNQRILRSDRTLLLSVPLTGGSIDPAPKLAPGPPPAAPAAAGQAAAGQVAAACGPADQATGGSAPAGGDLAGGSAAGQVPDGGVQPCPVMLPAAVPGFTGRDAELRALSAMLASGGQPGRPGRQPGAGPVLMTAIGGTAGVGKTALAVHWAREHAADFPDGQLYVNLRGFGPGGDPLAPAEALRVFLGALGVPPARIPATLAGRQSLYRGVLAGRRMLVVLDNARNPAQVRPLLPGTPGCLVIVTSRNRLTGLIAAEGARPLHLDLLSSAEARLLLAARLGPVRVAAEPAAAGELIRLCAGLPLALAVTAARAATRPGFLLAALAAELRDARHRLDALATGEPATDIRAVLSWSYHCLSPATARLFRLLGLHPGPDITAAAAASLAATTVGDAARSLRELTRDHLVSEHCPGRYAFHDLLRSYAAGQAAATDDDAGRAEAVGRALDHYLHTARAAALLFRPEREPVTLTRARPGVAPETIAGHEQALAWLEAEHDVLRAAVTAAARAGFDACAWQLPWAMADFLDQQGHYAEWADVQRTALAAATRLGDTAGQAIACRALAFASARLGDHAQARILLTDCLELHRRLGDRTGMASTHKALAWVADGQSRHADSLHHGQQALALFRAEGNQKAQALALNEIGWAHLMLGDPDLARTICQQALTLQQETGDRHGQAHTWDSIGSAEYQLGEAARAITSFHRAISIFRELGYRRCEAEILVHLGETCEACGQPDAARDAWQQAAGIFDDLRHPGADAVRAKLASAHSHTGREPVAAGSAPA